MSAVVGIDPLETGREILSREAEAVAVLAEV